jgi:uncharacterized protein involved in copper resistance
MKRHPQHWLAAGLLLIWAVSARAEPPEAATPAAPQASNGEATRAWLDRQARGDQASPVAQPLPGPAMERVYERYLKNFTHPIPEHFERERLGTGTPGQ